MSDRVQVDAIILMYAFRYALGRMTYAVGDVCRELRTHRGVLAKNGWDQKIVEEIDQADRLPDGLGHAHDREKWMDLRREFSK